MKIAYLVQVFPKISETFVLNQIAGMIEQGNQVDIYADQASNENKIHEKVKKYNLISKTNYFDIPNKRLGRLFSAFKIIRKNLIKEPKLLFNTLNVLKYGKESISLRLLFGVFNYKNSIKNYDIVHCQFGRNGLQALALREFNLLQGKLVVSIRGADISMQVKSNTKAFSELFKKADLFLPVCNYFKQELIKYGVDEKKIIVHRSGIDCNKFTFKPRKYFDGEEIKLVSIGRLVEKKGIEYGLKALKLLLKEQPDTKIHYTIVGDGPLKQELKQLCKKLQISEKVSFLDSMSHEEIVSVLNNSHILLAPSVTASNGDKEGIPNVIKEAMATGMPVISTYHSGIPELVINNKSGYLVKERDEKELAQKLLTLINNHSKWIEMGLCGRKIIEKYYDINKLNEELFEIYSNLVISRKIKIY